MQELKRRECPSCDLKGAPTSWSPANNKYRITCSRDACGFESGEFETEEEAMAAWNARATDKTIEALVDICGGMLACLKVAQDNNDNGQKFDLTMQIKKLEFALASVEGV